MEELIKALVTNVITILLGITTITLTIITLWQRHSSNEFQKKVYIEQGVFNKPNIDITLYKTPSHTKFIFAVPLNKEFWEIPLRINIENTGKKDSEELEIQYKINKSISYETKKNVSLYGPEIKNVKITQYDEGGPFITKIMTLDNIRLKQEISVDIPLMIHSSTICQHNIEIPCKDGNIIAKTWVNYSFPVDVIISQKEFGPVSKRFYIQIIDISDSTIEDFFIRYNKDLKKSNGKAKRGFFKRFLNIIRNNETYSSFILLTFDSKSKQSTTVKLSKKKIVVNKIPENAFQKQGGVLCNGEVSEEPGYIIPNITHKLR